MRENTIIGDGIYEITDISIIQKVFPQIFAYIKYDIKFDLLMFIPFLIIIYKLITNNGNLIDVLPYIIGLIMIEFVMFFAISRLLTLKNKKKQYIKISGNIVKLITEDLKKIEGYNLLQNYAMIYSSGNIITIILEAHKYSGNIIIKSAVTFPSNCIENKVLDGNIINSIKATEKEIYNEIMNENIKLDVKKINAIRDIIDSDIQYFNRDNNIK